MFVAMTARQRNGKPNIYRCIAMMLLFDASDKKQRKSLNKVRDNAEYLA